MSHRLDRYELKFLISAEQRERLMAMLLPRVRADENAGVGARYPIVSLYYDTPDRDCYWDNIDERKSRRKLRVRVYGSLDGVLPPTIFAEVKHKLEGRNVKRRARMSLEQALAVGAGEEPGVPLAWGEERTVAEIHALVRHADFRPCCCMRYVREAYMGLEDEADLRITFDTGIAYRFDNLMPLPDDRNFQHFLYGEDFSVLEVKVTGAVPYWLAQMLAQLKCQLQSHSKYCRAMEAGDPILRARLERHGRLPVVATH